MPAASNIAFNQRAMVLAVTAPCGFRIRVVLGQSLELPGKEGKKNSEADLPFALTVLLVY